MTDQDYLESHRADCNFAAQDAKNAADYAAYNFSKGHDEEAIKYAQKLQEHAANLMSHIGSLRRWIEKTKTV